MEPENFFFLIIFSPRIFKHPLLYNYNNANRNSSKIIKQYLYRLCFKLDSRPHFIEETQNLTQNLNFHIKV